MIIQNWLSRPFEDFRIPPAGKNIPSDTNNQSNIFPNHDTPTLSPPTLEIIVTSTTYDFGFDETGFLYTIKMGIDIILELYYPTTVKGVCSRTRQAYLRNISGNTSATLLSENISPENKASFNVQIQLLPSRGKEKGDVYILYLPRFLDPCNTTTKTYNYILLRFSRSLAQNSSDNTTGNTSTSQSKVCTNVPLINISGQTLVDGSDVGQIVFNILDKYYYYNVKTPLTNKICHLDCIPEGDLKDTIFNKSCPKMASVFIGEGSTLYIKVDDVWNNSDLNINLQTFYENVIRYGMLRYILSKLLYGNFNINYLLRKYYNTFLKDLRKSRFCNFVEFFTNPTYSDYYKFFQF